MAATTVLATTPTTASWSWSLDWRNGPLDF
ncbi:uncharacterized protein G2W53_033792 [Senna tora]|uniref:Uncharacterized protein n=1 Tax=Senna tora TaxID=362788 RepID=A0A834T055_9FABA|nr:uncharacterized protein G2W53_033792 [Senna tora]